MKLTRMEIARAVLRLQRETVAPVEQLAPWCHLSAKTLERYIIQGKRGVHLDGCKDHATGIWMSSVEAIERFLAAVEKNESPTPPQPAA